MTGPERRTPEQIREEIRAARSALDADLAALGADAKRSGRIAGSAFAAVGSMLLLARRRARRRRS